MAPTSSNPSQGGGMFHTFQGVNPRRNSTDTNDHSRGGNSGVSKRITTPHACVECKRRKIRCDGTNPCGQCCSSRAPKKCVYDKHRQRVVPSRKALSDLEKSLNDCRAILRRLFPAHKDSELLPLQRAELLKLLDRPTAAAAAAGSASLPSPPARRSSWPYSSDGGSPEALVGGGGGESCCTNLEGLSIGEMDWEELQEPDQAAPAEPEELGSYTFPALADEQASSSSSSSSSYMGASSIQAALAVMLKMRPGLGSFMGPTHVGSPSLVRQPAAAAAAAAAMSSSSPRGRVPWDWTGQTLIDAYFKRVHVLAPMLDESSLRADYREGRRGDRPWLALLNMVFALGSIAAMKSDDRAHAKYHARAAENLPLGCLGAGEKEEGEGEDEEEEKGGIETLQALVLMGGLYLHYVDQPGMAHAVMGAAVRMAVTMGLHREDLSSPPSTVEGGPQHSAGMPSSGIVAAAGSRRRRTWWSIFCLDSWASATSGRPSIGRCFHGSGAGVAVGGIHTAGMTPPLQVASVMSSSSSSSSGAGARDPAQQGGVLLLPLAESIRFCQLAAAAQDLLTPSSHLRQEQEQVQALALARGQRQARPGQGHGQGQQQQPGQVHLAEEEVQVLGAVAAEDRCDLDGQLVDWYAGLPWLLRSADACAEPLYNARCILKWRYQNLRMLLHRPVLLAHASLSAGSVVVVDASSDIHTTGAGGWTQQHLHAGAPHPYRRHAHTHTHQYPRYSNHMTDHDAATIEACRELARQTVEDIGREWVRNQMSGWHAASFLAQAATVPLVSMLWQWDSPRVPEWRCLVEKVLVLLAALDDWAPAARRCHDVVARLYDAATRPAAPATHPHPHPHPHHQQQRRASLVMATTAAVAGRHQGGPSPSSCCSSSTLSPSSASPTSPNPLLGLSTAAAGALGGGGGAFDEFHMSPIGFEESPGGAGGFMGMLDQQSLWDLDSPVAWGSGTAGAGAGPGAGPGAGTGAADHVGGDWVQLAAAAAGPTQQTITHDMPQGLDYRALLGADVV